MKFICGLFVVFTTFALTNGSDQPERGGGRIVGGVTIPITEAPYQVGLLYGNSLICGGSIISRNFILSACHCTNGRLAQYFSIRAGSYDQLSGGQVIRVSRIINHPSYNARTTDYDFTLLSLAAAINLDGRTTAVISLPLANELIADGTVVQISGWGTTSQTSNQSSRYLRGTNVLTVNQSKCSSAYGRYGVFISNQMVCAGFTGKDTCSGDSGGPLKAVNSNKLIGVVSFGIGCADPSFPGVYSRVASVRTWIKTNTGI